MTMTANPYFLPHTIAANRAGPGSDEACLSAEEIERIYATEAAFDAAQEACE